jgi:hypothetical protein
MPESVKQQLEALRVVMDATDGGSLPIDTVAAILGIDKDCLRESIADGTCPFGVGGRNPGGNRFGRCPKAALWNWMTK